MKYILAVIFLVSIILSSCGAISTSRGPESFSQIETSSLGPISDTSTIKPNKNIPEHPSFPYLALLRVTSPIFEIFSLYLPKIVDCGGSIISDRWVITAAHCFKEVKFVVVIVGEIGNRQNEVRLDKIYPKHIHLHPAYRFYTDFNDIALINTPKITFSRLIGVIRLPKQNSHTGTYISERALSSGWKITTRHNGRFLKDNRIFFYAELTIVECPSRYLFKEEQAFTCTPAGNRTTECFGDSGVPLSGFDENGPILYGIAYNVNAHHCIPQYRTVFTRVEPHLLWIQNMTGLV